MPSLKQYNSSTNLAKNGGYNPHQFRPVVKNNFAPIQNSYSDSRLSGGMGGRDDQPTTTQFYRLPSQPRSARISPPRPPQPVQAARSISPQFKASAKAFDARRAQPLMGTRGPFIPPARPGAEPSEEYFKPLKSVPTNLAAFSDDEGDRRRFASGGARAKRPSNDGFLSERQDYDSDANYLPNGHGANQWNP